MEETTKNKKEIAIVYLLAGMSRRFGGRIKGLTKVGPNDETMVEYSLNQAIKIGFSKIYFVVGKETEAPFKEAFGDEYKGIPISYALQKYDSEERDKPWGTCDALCSLVNSNVDCGFVVCNGDDIYGEETLKVLYNHLLESDDCATIGSKLIKKLPEVGTVNRGIYKIDDEGYVISINEALNISRENLDERGLTLDDISSLGIFGLQANLIGYLDEKFNEFKKEHDGDRVAECLLPEELGNLIENGRVRMKLFEMDEVSLGITNPGDEEGIRKVLAERV